MKDFMNKIPLFALSLLVLFLAGCMKDKQDEPAPEPIPTSYLSLYNASPTAQEFDFKFDSLKVNTKGIKYVDYTGYLRVKPGAHNIQFSAVNAANPLIDTSITFEEKRTYSLFLVESQPSISLVATSDSIITPPVGKAVLRVTQLSPDAPMVNISATGMEGKTDYDSLQFKRVTQFLELPSGTHSIQVKNTESGESLLNNFNIQLTSGKVYTLILRGYVTPPSGNTNILSAQLITDY